MSVKLESPPVRTSETLLNALLARTSRAVRQITGEVGEQVAADAVSASSDALVLLRLLEQPTVLEQLRRADPLAPARLRGIEARARLVELAGGLLSSAEAAEALGITRQAIEKRRRAGRLLSVSLGKRGYRYPAFQFAGGQTLTGLERVLDALGPRDPWTQVGFFVNRRSDLDGRAPIDILQPTVNRAGDDAVDAVVAAAEADADQGAA